MGSCAGCPEMGDTQMVHQAMFMKILKLNTIAQFSSGRNLHSFARPAIGGLQKHGRE